MKQIPWFERRFNFDFPSQLYPEIISRLTGAPSRLEELIRRVDENLLITRTGERWSIQEIAGHLGDLESLWYGRVEDILNKIDPMREAELTNRMTHEANHNDCPVNELTESFRTQREKLITRLESLEPDDFARSCIHPRLHKPMRIADLCFFTAEHDDFHLARIRELLKLLK